MAKKSKRDVILKGEIVDSNGREAPQERVISIKDILQPAMSIAQLRILTNETPRWAIKVRQGRGGKLFKYVPHGYVTDQLNQAFGFNWDLIVDPMGDHGKRYELIYEEILNDKGSIVDIVRHVSVAGHVTVRILVDKRNNKFLEITKYGFGSQTWNKTMEFGDALKGARSDLVKTCAYQFGVALDLYWNERAEFDEYELKKEKQAESVKTAKQLMSGEPTTAVLLLSRAMSDFQMDGSAVTKKLGISIDELLVMDMKGIKNAWNKLFK